MSPAFIFPRLNTPCVLIRHLACAALMLPMVPGISVQAAPKGLPTKAGALFEERKVWTVHLQFTPEEWAAIEPAGGPPNGFGGPPRGPEGPGGPGRRGEPGGPPGGPRGFGPSMLLAPMFLQAGDDDKDAQLSKVEFLAIPEKWFASWDKDKTGQITSDQLREGLNAAIIPPGPRRGPGGGPPFGGPPPLQGADGKRNGLASAMGIEFKYVHADLEFDGAMLKDVAVRYKGNGTYMGTRGSLKRSFKIDLNKYVKGQKIADQTTLNLHTNVTDPSWMNEPLSHRLYRDAEVPASRTTYARVFLTVPGKYEHEYVGLYSIVENVDKHFAEENFDTKKGAIFKPVTPNLFADLGDSWSKYKQIYDPKDEVSADEAQRVINCARFVTHADDAEFAEKLSDYFDLDEVARYFAVTVWLSTMDSILSVGQNYYLYLDPKTHRFQFIPWDLDHSFGQFMGGDQNARLSIHRPWRGENRFLERLFKVEAFETLYLAKLEEFSKTLFLPARFEQQVDAIAEAIRPAIEEESNEKLASFDRAVAGESPQSNGGGPGGPMFGGMPIKPFAKARAQSVIDQLAGKAEDPVAPGGFGPGGPGGPPQGFGPGNMLAPLFLNTFDTDKDGALAKAELTEGFARWFTAWSADNSDVLTEEQLRAGIDKQFTPPRGGPPGRPERPGFGPPQ